MRGYWRAWGLRLAFAALVLQAAVPLFILADLRALAADETADAIAGQALCIHDGSSQPSAPVHPCSLAVCPLCAALAVASAPGMPGAPALVMPPVARSAPVVALAEALAPREASSLPYRSRAPPQA